MNISCSRNFDPNRRQNDGQDRYRHPQGPAGGWPGLGAAAFGQGGAIGGAGVAAGEGAGGQRRDPGLQRAGGSQQGGAGLYVRADQPGAAFGEYGGELRAVGAGCAGDSRMLCGDWGFGFSAEDPGGESGGL
ncbi:hypothetical protein BBAD15_g12360 [Beauveria bassiana D1-5]|uniref:Uncharacterized protein n=1 Tax=Beauveria bassiana D1-5 TaxID=1245745 RepID=A0A0A2V7V5_BEABA|nr:hypothetical protein BBAD15_g12360 [Beauveria bassiana D1-5]